MNETMTFSSLYENIQIVLEKPAIYAEKITRFLAGGLGACAGIMSNALNKTDANYVGHYAVQLKAYEDALIDAGVCVKAKLVYYSVLGYLVELEG